MAARPFGGPSATLPGMDIERSPGLPVELTAHVLESLDIGVIVVDADLRVVYANVGTALDDVRTAGAGVEHVLRENGEPWPAQDWPIQVAVRDGLATSNEVMGLVRSHGTDWVQTSARPFFRGGETTPFATVVTYHDVTERQQAIVALSQSEAHFRLLAENSTDVIQRFTVDGRCLYCSPACQDVLGRRPADLLEALPAAFIHPHDIDRVTAFRRELLRTRAPGLVTYRVQHGDGRWIWAESMLRSVPGRDGRVEEVQSATRDVSTRVEAEQRLARLALTDALTGLANRAALVQRLEDLLGAHRGLALLFLDLDRFKVVNDSLGHSAGDELLRVLAGRLSGICRGDDVVARLGGDEFVLLAAGLDEAGALLLTQRVQQVLAAPVEVSGHELIASASIGVVVSSPGAVQDAEQLLRDADASMYRAKSRGRARAVVWTHEIRQQAVTLLSVERDLRVALDDGQLLVHYQPLVDLATGRVTGVESLVRWQHPKRGLLLPASFLDVAEETGLVGRLGAAVLTEASRQVAAWRRVPGYESLGLSVNASGQELGDPTFAEQVLRVLVEQGLSRAALTIEVLESVLLDAEGSALAALTRVADLGIGLVLDDFGTGASSLLHLRHLPVGGVKLDRSFVAGLGSSRIDEAIVRAVGLLTTDLGLSCVAEGVETAGQHRWLVEQGFTHAQGFLLHRPVPAAQLTADLLCWPGQMGSVVA